MLIFEARSWPQHRPWVYSTLVVALLSIAWYVVWTVRSSDWPGGSSLPGFTFGVVGGAICFFEGLLWFRKRVRTWRIGRAQVWMRAHIWLGLLSVPLLAMHSGFRLGGELAAILMILFLVVIASGVWGLVFQQFIPNKIFADIPAETIYSQIDHVVAQMAQDADYLVEATCGPAPGEVSVLPQRGEARSQYLTVGAVRSAGRVKGKVLQTVVPSAPIAGTEMLRDFYLQSIKPYLSGAAVGDVPLRSARKAEVLFHNLKTNLEPAAHHSVDALEGMCDQRRQFDEQARMHFWLHCWLWVHLPLSAALIVLMFVHIFKACKYW